MTKSKKPNKIRKPSKNPSGLLILRSGTKAHLKALEDTSVGKLVEAGRRQLADGEVESVFVPAFETPPGEENPIALPVGERFYANATKAYKDWPVKWWREAVQNAVDAKATRIDLSVEETDEGVVVQCKDNGKGMDSDILVNKFLFLGETGKGEEGDSTTGGFGKAKEMLLLPWIWWRIRTNDLEIRGAGGAVDDGYGRIDPRTLKATITPKSAPYQQGTTLTVCMRRDECTRESSALEYLQNCTISGINVYVNGRQFTKWLPEGKKKRSIYRGVIRLAEGPERNTILVRSNGLFMFSVGRVDGPRGTLTCELTGKSKELLTDNRDSFSDWRVSDELYAFISELASDTKSALDKEQNLITKIWKGTGGFTDEQGTTTVLKELEPLRRAKKKAAASGKPEDLSDAYDQVKKVVERLKEVAGAYKADMDSDITGGGTDWGRAKIDGKIGFVAGAALNETVERLVNKLPDSFEGTEAVAQQLAWTPDFMLVNMIPNRDVSMFEPSKMTPELILLAKVWAELCRWCFIQRRRKGAYGIGFYISDKAAAAYRQFDGRHWLLLNPYAFDSDDGIMLETTHDPRDREDLKDLYADAVHEFTHLSDGAPRHDEAFSTALTYNMARTADGFGTAMEIVQVIVKNMEQARDMDKGARRKKKAAVARETSAKLHVSLVSAGEIRINLNNPWVLEVAEERFNATYPDLSGKLNDQYRNKVIPLPNRLNAIFSDSANWGAYLTGDAGLCFLTEAELREFGRRDAVDAVFDLNLAADLLNLRSGYFTGMVLCKLTKRPDGKLSVQIWPVPAQGCDLYTIAAAWYLGRNDSESVIPPGHQLYAALGGDSVGDEPVYAQVKARLFAFAVGANVASGVRDTGTVLGVIQTSDLAYLVDAVSDL